MVNNDRDFRTIKKNQSQVQVYFTNLILIVAVLIFGWKNQGRLINDIFGINSRRPQDLVQQIIWRI